MALQQPRPGPRGVGGDEAVELAAAHDVPVLRVHGVGGPLQLQLAAHARGAQALVAVVALELRAEPHVDELLDGPWCEPVAARLLAGERLALDDRDVVTVAGQPVCGGRAGGTATDDEDIGRDGGR